jgi:hypothetical protein
MSNPFVAVTQTKTLTVTFKDASGNVIAAGGNVVFTIPAGIVGGTQSTQATPLTGQTAGQNYVVTAKEPVSGFTGSFTMDVAAIQMLITQASFVLA